MFCPKCGRENSLQAVFCRECGAKINTDSKGAGGQNLSEAYNVSLIPPAKERSNIKLLAIKLFACIITTTIFFVLGENLTSPEKIAERYFLSRLEGDWGRVYQLLDIPESELLSRDAFINSNVYEEGQSITNYQILSHYSTNFSATAEIEYRITGEAISRMETISLTKGQKKKFLFFDNWQVASSDYMATETVFFVPKYADALLDGYALEPYRDFSSEDDLWDQYTISNLFAGTHELSLEHEQMEGLSGLIELPPDSGYIYYGTDLELQDSVKKELFEKACSDYEVILEAAVNKKSFSEIADRCYINSSNIDEMRRRYEYISVEYNPDEGYGLQQLVLGDITGYVEQYYENSSLSVLVQLEFDYGYTDTEYGFDTGNGTASFMYLYIDGVWCLDNYILTDISF